jgi:hypothetical protein
MSQRTSFIIVLSAAVASWLATTPAQGQRVFVAAQGADANPCTFALPCRTFQHAHDVVAAGGEIDVLDPAGYGAVTITKAISIQGHGFSGISIGSGGTGITINAGGSDEINLNGLLIEGSGVGSNGILFNNGGSLIVQNSIVRNLAGSGLVATASTANSLMVSLSNSYFTDTGVIGVSAVALSTGSVRMVLERVGLLHNQTALSVNGSGGTGSIEVVVTESTASHNNLGFIVQSLPGHSLSTLELVRVLVSSSASGVQSSGTNAQIRLAQSTIMANGTGFNAGSGGTILSYGDNYIDDNTGNTGTLGAATKQ